MMEIIDISPLISSQIAVWPGDTPYQREVSMDTDKGDHLGLSVIRTTLHLGAHVDAPNHYLTKSQGIDQRSLRYYYGPAQVISVETLKGQRIEVKDLLGKQILAPRILLKTNSFPDPNQWNDDFCSLSEELVSWLASENVLLVGIDTPSIDPLNSKALEAHHKIAEYNMAILEGVVLNSVEDGVYHLSALPLRLKDADASPVRAILVKQ